MKFLGLDLGSRTLGVSVSDKDGITPAAERAIKRFNSRNKKDN